MQRFYSPSADGFFSEDIHGVRLIDEEGTAVPNPHCLIPEDAIAIDDDQWTDLLIATSVGKRVVVIGGRPQAVLPESEGEA